MKYFLAFLNRQFYANSAPPQYLIILISTLIILSFTLLSQQHSEITNKHVQIVTREMPPYIGNETNTIVFLMEIVKLAFVAEGLKQ